jgi:hypothetical protein
MNDQSPARSTSRARWAPALAGIAYVTAWVAGLSVWPSNLAVNSSGTEVVASYRGHTVAVTAQLVLVEALAGVLLAAVVVGLGRSLSGSGSARRSSSPVPAGVAAGLGAALVAVTQCGLGLAGVATARRGNTSATGELFSLVNRLDGVKMLLIAGAAVCFAAGMRASGRWPGWLMVTGLALAASLVFSAIAYLVLLQDISWAVYLSGPLLLVWVAASGVRTSLNARSEEPGR